VKTGILLFRKPHAIPDSAEKGRRDKEARAKRLNRCIWFYQIDNDGYDPDKIQGGGRPETPEQNDLPEMLRQWTAFKESGFKKPPGVEAGTLLKAGTDEPKCWWAKLSVLAENEYNLTAGRHKPRVAEKVLEEDPAELITKTLGVERSIVADLERLLTDVERTK
jgi:type I restriction enzyme M protein